MRKIGETIFVDVGSDCYRIICGALRERRIRDYVLNNFGFAPHELVAALNIIATKVDEEIEDVMLERVSSDSLSVHISLKSSSSYVPSFVIPKSHLGDVVDDCGKPKQINFTTLAILTTAWVGALYTMNIIYLGG